MEHNTIEAAQAFTLVKSSVELYKIRHTSGCYWADITIDANGRTGRISIASDYGNWQNYWGACGTDFKSFLATLNFGYVASKFGAEPWIDVDKSLDGFKESVAESKLRGNISKEEARELRDGIKELRGENASSISQAVYHSDKLYAFLYENAGEIDFAYEDNPHFLSFWKEIWPVMLAEFAREAETATSVAA